MQVGPFAIAVDEIQAEKSTRYGRRSAVCFNSLGSRDL